MSKKMQSTIDILCEGFKDGGITYVTNFPGFESHKIFQKLGGKLISANERVAYDNAFGASLAGKRSLVCMKSVGLNVAADSFLHTMLSGVNGGFVLTVTDDVKVIGSQERLDSRHYFDFYGGLWFEPSTCEEIYKVGKLSFEASENLDIPIVIRLTNQTLFQTEKFMLKKSKLPVPIKKPAINNPSKYVVHPVYWRDQLKLLEKRKRKIDKFVFNYYSKIRRQTWNKNKGIIVFGNCEQELERYNLLEFDLLRISSYPFPNVLVREFSKNKNELIVLEQGDPFAYERVQKIIKENTQNFRISSYTGDIADLTGTWRIWKELSTFFKALNSINPSFVVSDVTQFTVESESMIDACLCLGAAIGIGIGLASSGVEYPFCIVGDVSFIHGGYIALMEAISRNISMGIVIVDNGGSWCTGGQKTTFNIYNLGDNISIRKLPYKKCKEEDIKNVLNQMRKSNHLSILYLQVN